LIGDSSFRDWEEFGQKVMQENNIDLEFVDLDIQKLKNY